MKKSLIDARAIFSLRSCSSRCISTTFTFNVATSWRISAILSRQLVNYFGYISKTTNIVTVLKIFKSNNNVFNIKINKIVAHLLLRAVN